MRSINDIIYKDECMLDLHLPESDNFDVFIYFHGGGLCEGNRKGVEVFAKTLAEQNIATASIEYRMYPDAKFPDFIEDCAASVAWLKKNISSYGNAKRFFVGGSSAGGYISMMLCFDDRYFAAVGMKPTDIDAYIHDAGQPTSHFNVLKELGKDPKRLIVDETAPMYFIGMNEKYSPMLFIVSDNDMPCRYEQTMLMIKTLEHFGHVDNVKLTVMNGGHCEYVYKADENGDGALANIIIPYIKTLK